MENVDSNQSTQLLSLMTVLISPILMIIGGLITWFIKSRTEELRAIEEKLRDDRRRICLKILEPFIMIFAGTGKDATLQKKAENVIQSLDFRRITFELSLISSDEVMRAWNSFMRYAYEVERTGKPDTKIWFLKLCSLLLAMRKNLGNKRTKLKPKEMMEAMVKDLDSVLG